jgi:hypothetical protein
MTQLRLNPAAVSWREVDGEILALGLASSTYLSTKGTGARLWLSLAEGACREDLVGLLVGEYDVAEDRAAHDVDAFVGALSAQGLLCP